MKWKVNRWCLFSPIAVLLVSQLAMANPVKSVQSLIRERCISCHSAADPSGDVNLQLMRSGRQMRASADLIDRMINAISDSTMPPEDAESLDDDTRQRFVAALKEVLRQADLDGNPTRSGVARLNRFQYNNTVKDLFQLNREVFALPEKLMTRLSPYLQSDDGKVPEAVQVASLSLTPAPGLQGINPFPKDSRAEHGFDNQADKLTLSPLLLDAFLRLSLSIVNSPEFNEQTVGVWANLFAEPDNAEAIDEQLQLRLRHFLPRAFRASVDQDTVSRYIAYAKSRIEGGESFTQSMKLTVSAILSSPRFFYRVVSGHTDDVQHEIASNLSYTLWGSCPDDELLALAEAGSLSDTRVLNQTISRMMADPKIERFLDSFPVQWMQLENLLAVTPDPAVNRYFSIASQNPATLQMVIEPLLLFDTVFLENRPVGEFLAPGFSYRSPFLETWYKENLQPKPVDEVAINIENAKRQSVINERQVVLPGMRKELADVDIALKDPVSAKVVDFDLAAGQEKWELAQAKLLESKVELSAWHRIGPFAGGTLEAAHSKAFIDETAVDLKKAYGDQKWAVVESYEDGKPHQLTGARCATYVYRTINSSSAQSLEISLGSDDGFKLWHNGVIVAERLIVRGLAPDQEKIRLELTKGVNTILFKISNGDAGYGFYFKSKEIPLPPAVLAALAINKAERSKEQLEALANYYLTIAPELVEVRRELAKKKAEVIQSIQRTEEEVRRLPQPKSVEQHRADAQRAFDDQIRGQLRSREFRRVPVDDSRFGGIITNAAMLSMTSGPKRTHPVARGVWITEVIFNDPPSPPPNDIPPLNEDAGPENLTIREKFAAHRENPSCAGCHSKLDPLGFSLENYDITGRWRDNYDNGREVDPAGTLMRKYEFQSVTDFKDALVRENERFARAFISHLLRFVLARELGPADSIVIDEIADATRGDAYRLKEVLAEVVQRAIQVSE